MVGNSPSKAVKVLLWVLSNMSCAKRGVSHKSSIPSPRLFHGASCSWGTERSSIDACGKVLCEKKVDEELLKSYLKITTYITSYLHFTSEVIRGRCKSMYYFPLGINIYKF